MYVDLVEMGSLEGLIEVGVLDLGLIRLTLLLTRLLLKKLRHTSRRQITMLRNLKLRLTLLGHRQRLRFFRFLPMAAALFLRAGLD